MKIVYNPEFENRLIDIVDYIIQDKPSAGMNFAVGLEKSILLLVQNPFQYRQSRYFEDENIRDMIYKGYTIVYEVNVKMDYIEILQIFNRNKP